MFVVDVPPPTAQITCNLWTSVSKNLLKPTMKSLFSSWYADQVRQQIGTYKPIDLRLSILKSFGTKWFVKTFEHVQGNPEIIKNGFGATGIHQVTKEVDQELLNMLVCLIILY